MPHLALVTGSAKRLGRAIALRLAAEGCDMIIHYRASREEAEEVASQIVKSGAKAMSVAFDQTSPEAIDEGFNAIRQFYGRAPDVLVNSASIYEADDISSVTKNNLSRHYDANLAGPVLLTRKLHESSDRNTNGAIINILDYKLFAPNPDNLSYTLSKYALQGFTELMSRALAPRFRVNAIAPGYTLPDVSAANDAHFIARHDETPLERGPTAEDIADAAAYLLKARATTGQTIMVDGGRHIEAAARDPSAT